MKCAHPRAGLYPLPIDRSLSIKSQGATQGIKVAVYPNVDESTLQPYMETTVSERP